MSEQSTQMECDILIVGAGPAGLATAIHLAQYPTDPPLNIVVLEKGASVGAHLLSGAIFDTRALTELIPDWQARQAPIETPIIQDQLYYLTRRHRIRLPLLPDMKSDHCHLISLGLLCQWLSNYAQTLGVSIFCGVTGQAPIFNEDRSAILGIKTGAMGLTATGEPTERSQPPISIYAKQVVIAEGCRGSLAEEIMKHFELRQHSDPQTYGLGFKELWQLPNGIAKPGCITHTLGWPLPLDNYGGGFIYHYDAQHVGIGFVMALDYQNPYLDPFKLFQQFKTHASIRTLLAKGRCLKYGARALNEGGYQAIPTLHCPGAILVGCSAGFLNVVKIKGIHNAIRSGQLAAKAICNAWPFSPGRTLTDYSTSVKHSVIAAELHRARNVRPAFRYGRLAGILYSAIDQWLLRGRAPWTFSIPQSDAACTAPAKRYHPIDYPKPDNTLTFDRLTQLNLATIQYREHQPNHLMLSDPERAISVNWKIYASPEVRYCPAQVYEIVMHNNEPRLQINAGNCIHCKTCDIKDPTGNIRWVPPEGGSGPNYINL